MIKPANNATVVVLAGVASRQRVRAEGPGSVYDIAQHGRVRARGGEQVIDLAQAGPGEQLLVVGYPLAARGQYRVRRLRRRLRDEPGALGETSVRSVVRASVAERLLGPAPPDQRCPFPQRRRVLYRRGQLAVQNALNRQFRQHQIGRDAREVEQQRLDVELTLPRRGDFAVNDVQVAVVNVGLATVDLQPGPAVEYALAPASDLEDLPRPADVAQRLRVEAPSVVNREVPVAVRPIRPFGPRPAERDRLHPRQLGERPAT